jgi:Ca-activated chloride channel family protein
MRFVRPELLLLLLALPLWGVGIWVAAIRRRRALERFAGGRTNVSSFVGDVARNRRAVRLVLFGVGLACVVLALARPQWGERVETVERTGIDLVVVLDTSLSMATQDVSPDRFRRAQLAASELISRLGGDRVGLVAFAGKASLLCPLTLDHEAVRMFLDVTDLDIAPIAGTALADALGVARRSFRSETDERADSDRSRVIVVYSDGEDHEAGLDEAVANLRRDGIEVFAVGVGTVEGGPIPITDDRGAVTDYKKDRDGRVVSSRLAEDVLERIALDTGGRYFRATAAGLEIDDVLSGVTSGEAGSLGTTMRIRYEERFGIPLILALIALGVEVWLADGRGQRVSGGR